MTNWGTAVPIIVAIIGISGIILPSLSTPFINQVYNKPDLHIDIGPENGKTMINLTNSGTIPATNLSLILTLNKPNKVINSITNLFSTVNVTLSLLGSPHSLLKINRPLNINLPYLELHVKKLVNGGGSLIKLGVDGKDTKYTDYTAYVTYDQGSMKMTGGERGYLFGFTSLSEKVLIAIYFSVAESIVLVFVLVYIQKWSSKRMKRRLLYGITQEMLDVRTELRETVSNQKYFSDEDWTTIPRASNIQDILNEYISRRIPRYHPPLTLPAKDKRKIISDIDDYIRISDFYSKLAERNSYINNNVGNIDDIELVKLNKVS